MSNNQTTDTGYKETLDHCDKIIIVFIDPSFTVEKFLVSMCNLTFFFPYNNMIIINSRICVRVFVYIYVYVYV